MTDPLRIAFMGTPDFARLALQALIESDHEVVCVYSQPPRPKGRGKKIQKSPVHIMAEDAGIEVRTPLNFKNAEDLKAFEDLNLDVAVVAAYGLILPKALLDMPKHGCINIHASLLPRWRGAAPIHRAIWAGDDETGVTLMKMDEGLDTGDIITVQKTPITDRTTSPMLHNTLIDMGAEMIVKCLDTLSDKGTLETTPQPEDGVTYAERLTKEEGRIDWTQKASDIDRQARALNPWPGTWSLVNDKRIKILETKMTDEKTSEKPGTVLADGKISCGDRSVLMLSSIQPENKKPMDLKTALNGGHLRIGYVLS